ncbi:MAG: hypothetical protein JXA98_02605 [Methanosarcinaceae archaeon]|nr:hypothetical protein [Methanosarcinaceae archaeon]
MFTINYEFQDGGPLYKCTYPQKEDSDNNIFFIRGTNDQGKTTALNMVALGLYANESFIAEKGIISDSLRAKMDYLSSDTLDRLKFDFDVKSRDGLTSISSEYDNGALATKFNGELIGSEYLNENIQVLYDVPDDPLVKLDSSVRLIKENLLDYERYLQRYYEAIESEITQIMDYKEKDNKIRRKTDDLKEIQKDLGIKRDLKERIENELSELETAENVLSYYEILDQFEQTDRDLKIQKERRTKLRQNGVGGETPKFKEKITEFNQVEYNIKSSLLLIKKYSAFLSKEQTNTFKSIGKRLNSLSGPRDLTIKNIDKWREDVNDIHSQLINDPILNQFKEEEKQSELAKKIMEVLRNYLSLEMDVPGTNVKGVFQFYKQLDEFNKNIEPKISRKRDLNVVINEVDKLMVHFSDLKVKRGRIPDVDDKQMYEYENVEKEINQLDKKLKDLTNQASKYSDLIDSLNQDEIDKILENPGKREQYQRTSKEFKNLVDEIDSLERNETASIAIIKELGTLDTSPTYDEEWLNLEYDICDKLISKVIKWRQVLETVNFRKTDLGIKYDEGNDFFDALSEYFAEILKNVYFEKRSWDVEKVDLVKRQYLIKNRKPIKFIQMGTGHTALNSILSRIKQNFGGKKKIILVDEIGHMDEKNIGILVDEIKNQVTKGETLFALITIADSTVSEVTWEPITV